MSIMSQVAQSSDGAAVTPQVSASSTSAPVTTATAARVTPRSRADRFMLRMLRIDPAIIDKIDTEEVRKAHRAFRWSILVSAVRCTISYVIIPVLIPLISVIGFLASPIAIALCLVALVNGWLGVRRFWRTDHQGKWGYTWFMVLIYVISIGTIIHEIVKMVA